MERYVVPALGRIQLRELERGHIRGLAADLLGKLSRKSTRLVLGTLHTCLQDAVEDGLLLTNPAAQGRSLLRKVEPEPAAVEERVRAMDREQLQVFLSIALKHEARLHPILYLMSRTGARVGEALGLQWPDLDWRRGQARICRQIVGNKRLEYPKTSKTRAVDLSSSLQEILKTWDRDTAAGWLERGKPRPDWIFPTRTGTSMTRYYITKVMNRILRKAGLPHFSPHDLRHTYASQLLQQGESPAYVQRQLGHSDIRLTTGLYGRWLPTENRAAVDRLDEEKAR